MKTNLFLVSFTSLIALMFMGMADKAQAQFRIGTSTPYRTSTQSQVGSSTTGTTASYGVSQTVSKRKTTFSNIADGYRGLRRFGINIRSSTLTSTGPTWHDSWSTRSTPSFSYTYQPDNPKAGVTEQMTVTTVTSETHSTFPNTTQVPIVRKYIPPHPLSAITK